MYYYMLCLCFCRQLIATFKMILDSDILADRIIHAGQIEIVSSRNKSRSLDEPVHTQRPQATFRSPHNESDGIASNCAICQKVIVHETGQCLTSVGPPFPLMTASHCGASCRAIPAQRSA